MTAADRRYDKQGAAPWRGPTCLHAGEYLCRARRRELSVVQGWLQFFRARLGTQAGLGGGS